MGHKWDKRPPFLGPHFLFFCEFCFQNSQISKFSKFHILKIPKFSNFQIPNS